MAIYTGSSKHLGGTETVARKETFFYGLVQKNVLITGANGQLGSALKQLAESVNMPFRFVFAGSDLLDITNGEQTLDFVRQNSFEYIVNCAAYTAVDKAETDVDAAFAVNYAGAKNLAEAAASTGAKIIHISTDYVFDGSADAPYKEETPTRPISVYGESKLKGEEAIQSIAKEWIIIRTSWLYSEFGANFVKTMLRLMNEREELSIVSDQKGTPTYAVDLAEIILHILQFSEEKEWKTGVYHFSNGGETSWFGFAQQIKKLAGMERCNLRAIKTEEYKTAACRPMYSVMDTSKIQSAFNVVIPQWEEALERCLGELGFDN